MSVWKLIKLKFGRNVAHFGELGIGIEETSERVRSDTLFSAWITAYARLHGGDAVEELLKLFPSDVEENKRSHLTPPFRLSSTFLYREVNDKTIYYLPRPLQFPRNYPIDDDLGFAKTYKGLKYLPLEIWQRWYQEEGWRESDRLQLTCKTEKREKGYKGKELDQTGIFSYSQAFETHKIPKVAIDRITRTPNIYYTGCVQYQWEQNGQGVKSRSGLYFILHLADETLEANLRAALNLLGEEGLGGERSSGAGRFEMTWDDLPIEWHSLLNPTMNSNTSQCQSLLSLFWDNTIQPDFLHHASYELHQRGGWVGSTTGHQRRRQVVSMFGEGSVFTGTVPLTGKLADVTPQGFATQQHGHKIYRSGIALSIPIRVLQLS